MASIAWERTLPRVLSRKALAIPKRYVAHGSPVRGRRASASVQTGCRRPEAPAGTRGASTPNFRIGASLRAFSLPFRPPILDERAQPPNVRLEGGTVGRGSRFLSSRVTLAAVTLLSVSLACGGGSNEQPAIDFPETTPFSPALQARLHEIRDQAMTIRGLTLDAQVDEGMLTRDQLRAYFEEAEASVTEDERREVSIYNQALRMLHIIGPEDDVLTLSTESGSEDILGLYMHAGKKLILISDTKTLSREDKSVLAHEYTHGFQHAVFDMDEFYEFAEREARKDRPATEYGTTLSCVVEGDASLSDTLYSMIVLGPPPDAAASPPADENGPAEAPSGFDRYGAFNYNECLLWAADLYAQSGWAEINKAYTSPPWTTEQILHADKYLDGEGATSMKPIDISPRLGDDWEQLESAIFGEFDVYNYLVSILHDEAAASMGAAGWGVGWISIYGHRPKDDADEEQAALVHVALEFDTDSDFTEFILVYQALIRELTGRNASSARDGKAVCWTGDLEHAYVTWSETQRRIDIVMATDDDSLRRAASDSLSTTSLGTCPGW